MVVHVLRETLHNIGPWEPVVFYLLNYLLINTQVVVVLIEGVVDISSFGALAD
jgi:hypothetical protein